MCEACKSQNHRQAFEIPTGKSTAKSTLFYAFSIKSTLELEGMKLGCGRNCVIQMQRPPRFQFAHYEVHLLDTDARLPPRIYCERDGAIIYDTHFHYGLKFTVYRINFKMK
jgi:hypothetical protein